MYSNVLIQGTMIYIYLYFGHYIYITITGCKGATQLENFAINK